VAVAIEQFPIRSAGLQLRGLMEHYRMTKIGSYQELRQELVSLTAESAMVIGCACALTYLVSGERACESIAVAEYRA